MIIFVDRKKFKQKADHEPISFPPTKTIFWGKKKAGIKIIEIIIIPKKKKKEKRTFFIILIKVYISSDNFCLFFIILILDPLIKISIGLGLTL